MIGNGKTAEGLLLTVAFPSSQLAAVTVYYNGQSITTGAGIGFDTQPYDDCLLSINVGAVQGAVATLLNSVLECETDNPAAATALASASFTSRGVSATAVKETGSILCKNTKRYLFLKTEVQGSPVTAQFSALWIGGTPRSQPTPQSLVFDV